MNDYINNFKDSEYTGAIGMMMSVRPNSLASKRAIKTRWKENLGNVLGILQKVNHDEQFCEPVFLWMKK